MYTHNRDTKKTEFSILDTSPVLFMSPFWLVTMTVQSQYALIQKESDRQPSRNHSVSSQYRTDACKHSLSVPISHFIGTQLAMGSVYPVPNPTRLIPTQGSHHPRLKQNRVKTRNTTRQRTRKLLEIESETEKQVESQGESDNRKCPIS